MKSMAKFANVGVGTIQFLVSGVAIVPAFIADLVRYMWQNRTSPFAEDDDSNDPPLKTPFTDRVVAFKNNGLKKIISATEKGILDENKEELTAKYAHVITNSLKFLVLGFITGVAIAGAIATFPAGLVPLSFVIAGGIYGVVDSSKDWLKSFRELQRTREDAYVKRDHADASEESRAAEVVHLPTVAPQLPRIPRKSKVRGQDPRTGIKNPRTPKIPTIRG